MRGWVAAAVLALAFGPGCGGRTRQEAFTGEPYLAVWAGDADRQHADFLAVLDASPTSPSYGRVLETYPVRARGNEPQRLNALARDDRRVLATGVLANRVFAFDLRDPLVGRLAGVDEAGPGRRFWAPHEVVTLPNGHVVVACSDTARYRGDDPRELLGAPGGLVELTADGAFLREIPAADPEARHLILAPNGAAAAPSLGRLVTTNTAKGYTATARAERMPGISVQVWTYPQLVLLRTVVLEAGPRGEENIGPVAPRFFHHQPIVYVDTEGGGVYASDSVQTDTPVFRLVFDLGVGALGGGAAVTPDDRFYVVALGGTSRVASFAVDDPWKPRLVSAVRLDRDPLATDRPRRGGPQGLVMSADGTRVAVADYGVTVPAHTQDGDLRVYMLRLDPGSGRLRIDGTFRDELTGEVGVSFARTRWPHGETGPARPAGLLFTTPAPPQAKNERREDE